ncbi:hypothetical protein THII_2412 [Thioploca ingrica]|uniref:DUF29 domain-containing protein n=1 Tax=Thioploca ingrica TaxID=40754 RepID=A0A090AHF9_9GAMM|nr:hypothetical protein THII_2412 [Thioploca ingrica]
MNKAIDYETDFYAWASYNAQLLREGKFSELDIEHIAEELESMGKNNKRELISRLKILIGHLLKWQYQPGGRSTSWRGSIVEQRLQLNDLIEYSPSLKPQLLEAITQAYPHAVELASDDTGFLESVFPEICPYSQEQILTKGFFPEPD